MNITGDDVQSANLDHHGLVAAVCQDLGIKAKINAALGPGDCQRVVSAGTSVVAMILNGLGFTNRRLYLTPQFFANKPVEQLLGEAINASDLTDHTLGQTLDEIAAYGTSRLFGEVAFAVAVEQGLLGRNHHLDTTSLSVHGAYEGNAGVEAIELRHGYSPVSPARSQASSVIAGGQWPRRDALMDGSIGRQQLRQDQFS